MPDYKNTQTPAESVWVVARYEGDRLKSVKAHTESGIGYFEYGDGLYAFRYAGPRPVPEHLTEVVNPKRIEELERRRLQREGVSEKQLERQATVKGVQKAREIFENRAKKRKDLE